MYQLSHCYVKITTMITHTIVMNYDCFFVHLIECIIIATKKSIPFSNCITKPVRMSGWNIDMSIAREKSLFWHGLWILLW